MVGKYLKKNKNHIIISLLLAVFCVMVPYIVTRINMNDSRLKIYNPMKSRKYVIVPEEGKMDIEKFIPLSLYGIIPDGEIESFDDETLKVMIVIIRTYINYKINEMGKNKNFIYADSLMMPYTSYEELEKKWGGNYEMKYNKIIKLINETDMENIYYNNVPIYPYYHEISSGMTNSGEYEYLKSVDSVDDIKADKYLKIMYFTPDNIKEKLNRYNKEINTDDINGKISVNKKENSEYVESVNVGEVKIDVEDWEKIFKIPSEAFDFETFSEGYKVTVKGKGSGIGLSIFGAGNMAKNGKNYKEILMHYYSGVEIKQ